MANRQERQSPSGPAVSKQLANVTFAGGAAGAAAVHIVAAIPCTGLRTTDNVSVFLTAPLAAGAGLLNASCAVADQLTVHFINPTAAPIALGDVTLRVVRSRYTP